MSKNLLTRIAEAIPIYAAYGMLAMTPVDFASAFGSAVMRRLGPHLPSHKVAENNLKLVLPELTADHARILNGMWDNLGRVMGEYPNLGEIGSKRRLDITGAHHVEEVIRSGKPAIFFSGHFANWELPALAVRRCGVELALVFRAPNNKLTWPLLTHARLPITRTFVKKGNAGAREIMSLLRQGRSVGMLVDQKMNDGSKVPFFGRDAMSADAVVRLAERYATPLYPVSIERTEGARFHVTIYDRLVLPSTGDKSADTLAGMTMINQMLESWIRKRPEQWLWVHRRWPQS